MKLVLFDIDGTLIYHLKKINASGHSQTYWRFVNAVRAVFGKNIKVDETKNYNGWVDRQIVWDIVCTNGVSRSEFSEKFPFFAKIHHETALAEETSSSDKLHFPITEAVELAKILNNRPGLELGLLTGNVERMAWWKLDHAGITGIFHFGLFGDEADDRISLAKTAFAKAKAYFHHDFLPEDITVIGDAVGDILCAKAIGATVIIALTGGHTSGNELKKYKPDIIADNLLDPKVKAYFGLI